MHHTQILFLILALFAIAAMARIALPAIAIGVLLLACCHSAHAAEVTPSLAQGFHEWPLWGKMLIEILLAAAGGTLALAYDYLDDQKLIPVRMVGNILLAICVALVLNGCAGPREPDNRFISCAPNLDLPVCRQLAQQPKGPPVQKDCGMLGCMGRWHGSGDYK